MEAAPDTTVVELLRISSRGLSVSRVEGPAWRMLDADKTGVPLHSLEPIGIGDTIALGPGASVELGDLCLCGGPRGRAFAFVGQEAFTSYPGREDVPRLLRELEQMERQTDEGEDPLSRTVGVRTSFETVVARDFALHNLCLEAAHELDRGLAVKLGAVCLFWNGDAACVAVSEISVRKIRLVMSALGRPINAHLVDPATLDDLLEAAYGSRPE